MPSGAPGSTNFICSDHNMHLCTHSSWEVSNFVLRRKILRDFGRVPIVHLTTRCTVTSNFKPYTARK
ncbi:hypothetical protein QTP88_022755 [Uroleucon formosanum]